MTRYDRHLAAAIRDNLDRQNLLQENQRNGYELGPQSDDYERCAKRRMSEAVGFGTDQATMARNKALIHRLQNAFMKIRNGLYRYDLHYSWFKVRTTNNMDSV